MTDNEIIRAYEQLIDLLVKKNKVCIYEQSLLEDIFDILNRQEAEIERLTKDNEYILMQHKFDRRPNGDCWNDVIEKAKSEAINKFAHQLKILLETKVKLYYVSDRDCEFAIVQSTALKTVDNLVKEMTEGEQ